MSKTRLLSDYVLALDSVPFFGGSKVASENVLALLEDQVDELAVVVVSSDPASWRNQSVCKRLYEWRGLQQKEQGYGYFLRHILIVIQLVMWVCVLGKPRCVVGTSGPGNDIAMYWLGRIFSLPVVQLVHGPVARSQTLARALSRAARVAYLASSMSSLAKCLGCSEHAIVANPRYIVMQNGLPEAYWPSACRSNFCNAEVFWAASLLKWKGLETLTAALAAPVLNGTVNATVCFIRPHSIDQACSQVPLDSAFMRCYEAPENLDSLRAQCSIFVSTADREPFGLSILEALAAGLCVVIPADGAYWDQVLTDGKHCVKYRAGDVQHLASTLAHLQADMESARRIAQEGRQVSQNYRAARCYQFLITEIAAITGQNWLTSRRTP